jgi:DNA-directed RNA polymerase alpha subunit
MSKQIDESNLISREEVKNILRITDDRSLSYKKNFKIVVNDKGHFFDRREITEQLGTDFTEPFLDTKEASKYMEMSEEDFLDKVVTKKLVPFYSFADNKKGSKRLFKRSELDFLKEEPQVIYLHSNTSLIDVMRTHNWMKELMLFCMKEENNVIHLTLREKETLTELLNGNSIEGLAKKFNLPRERVRMIFEKAKRRINMNLYRNFKEIISKHQELTDRNIALEVTLKTLEARMPPKESDMSQDDFAVHKLLKTNINDLDLSVRAVNGLRNAEIMTLADLVRYKKEDLLKLRHCGEKTLREIEETVYSRGLKFGMDTLRYKVPTTEEEKEVRIRKLLGTNIMEWDFTVRALNCMKGAGIEIIADIVSRSKKDYSTLRNFGKKSIREITQQVDSHGLWFGMDIERYGFKKKKVRYND